MPFTMGKYGYRRLGWVHYEQDDAHFNADAYSVDGYKGIAFYAYGWEVEHDEDTDWSGVMERTGKVVVCMVGDDRAYVVDERDITALKREEYCGVCGQVGCSHDGLER